MAFEVDVLRDLGFEVFIPKAVPPAIRSSAVTAAYDSTLTLPASLLKALNAFDFYGRPWSPQITSLINAHFGTAFVAPQGIQVPQVTRQFGGRIMFRAFGLDGPTSYAELLESMHGSEIFAHIAAAGDRFRFAPAYRELLEVEPPLLTSRAIVLPAAVPETFIRSTRPYVGTDKRILFVCPECTTNPYYIPIYRRFKQQFGDLPHAIIGYQAVPVDDPNVIGFVSDAELIRLYAECAVSYYHSTEPRHVHYTPIEAAISGMPVVYYADSLLGRMTPEIGLGRVRSVAEARACIERILVGDVEYIEAIRKDQRSLPAKFLPEHCKEVWRENLADIGGAVASAPAAEIAGSTPPAIRALGKFARYFRRGPSARPPFPAPELMHPRIRDSITLPEGIDFRAARYPGFVRYVYGLGRPEAFGRWSLDKTVTIAFFDPLPLRFDLLIAGWAYGPNLKRWIKVTIGGVERRFKFTAGLGKIEDVRLAFSISPGSSEIEITVPKPVRPPNDSRRIGLVLAHMKIAAT